MIIGVERVQGRVAVKRWPRQVVTKRMRAWLRAGAGRRLYHPPAGSRIGRLSQGAESWARYAEAFGEEVPT